MVFYFRKRILLYFSIILIMAISAQICIVYFNREYLSRLFKVQTSDKHQLRKHRPANEAINLLGQKAEMTIQSQPSEPWTRNSSVYHSRGNFSSGGQEITGKENKATGFLAYCQKRVTFVCERRNVKHSFPKLKLTSYLIYKSSFY